MKHRFLAFITIVTTVSVATTVSLGAIDADFAFSATPISGPAPLTVNFECRGVCSKTMAGVGIDFGDGTSGPMADWDKDLGHRCPPAAQCVGRYLASHTYAKAGAYTAALMDLGAHCGEGGSCEEPTRARRTVTVFHPVTVEPPCSLHTPDSPLGGCD